MRAGALVKYVDADNSPQLGLVLSGATARDDAATVVPLAAIMTLGPGVLIPLSVPLTQSQYQAGGPPYWVADGEGLDAMLTERAVAAAAPLEDA